jgi:xanthine/CO dehydrogenase XdhC/CoxF family maturation factor
MRAALFEAVLAARAARVSVALVTRIADGTQTLVYEYSNQGELALSDAAVAEVRRRLITNLTGPVESDGGLFARIYAPAPRLVIVGAVHIAQHLAPMAAAVGFEVTIVDPRSAFATPERFPGVALAREWPDAALDRLALDAQSALVVLAHDPKIDDPALALALRGPAFYVGALGSRRTHAKRVLRLEGLGLGAELPRLHAPAGIDLGGRAAAEIAVAIIAEIIQARYLRARPGPAPTPA